MNPAALIAIILGGAQSGATPATHRQIALFGYDATAIALLGYDTTAVTLAGRDTTSISIEGDDS